MSVAFAQSRCRTCAFLREVTTARSTFLMCTEPSLPKYPPQPVTWCSGFLERALPGGEVPPVDEK
jgi:hypothetical protein